MIKIISHKNRPKWLNIVFILIALTVILFVLHLIFFKYNKVYNKVFILNNKNNEDIVSKCESYATITPYKKPTATPKLTYTLGDISEIKDSNIQGWKMFKNNLYKYSLEYPESGKISMGNARDQSLPADVIAIDEIDNLVTLIVLVENVEFQNEDLYISKYYKSSTYLEDVVFSGNITNSNNLKAKRIEIIQEGIAGTKTKTIYTTFIAKDKLYQLITVVMVDSKTQEPSRDKDKKAIDTYNKIVDSFNIFY